MVTSAATARLLLVDLDDVVVLHLEGLWSVVVVDPLAVEQKPQRSHRNALPLAVKGRTIEEEGNNLIRNASKIAQNVLRVCERKNERG